jgi:CheY-like chemotaxis protein
MVSLKLLVVEDDIANLELMTEVFTSLQAEVRPLSDSEEAAGIVNREKFDGIFLDLEMPNLNGFDLARLVRKSSWNKSTPIIIVTGRDERQTMQQAFALGATFFLQKPVDRQKLNNLFRTVRGGMLENRRRYTRVPLQTEVTCVVGSRRLQGMSWNFESGRGIREIAPSLSKLRQGFAVSFTRLQLPSLVCSGGDQALEQVRRHRSVSISNRQTLTGESFRDRPAWRMR